MDEVRYQYLRPAQIVKRRNECPVAYLPIGTLEWHGVHNPLGSDTLQAEGIAISCAQKAGGLVLPPLYYGENRLEALMEANAGDRADIASLMDLPTENFNPERFPFTVSEQTTAYQHLLLHMLAEMDTLGFKVGVLVPGHYPLIDHARAACLIHNQRCNRFNGMLAWAFVDYLLVRDQYPTSGDHAGVWETSHMMALHPDTVDLKTLGDSDETPVGVGSRVHPKHSTAEFGVEIIQAAVDVAVKEVMHRLHNPGCYAAHGMSMQEGVWKTEKGTK